MFAMMIVFASGTITGVIVMSLLLINSQSDDFAIEMDNAYLREENQRLKDDLKQTSEAMLSLSKSHRKLVDDVRLNWSYEHTLKSL